MKCLSETRMSRYVSGDVTADEANAIREHVSSCLKCRSLKDAFTDMTARLKTENADWHSSAAIHDIMTIIDVGKADTVSFRAPRVDRMRAMLAVAALLLAGVALGGVWWSIYRDSEDVSHQFQMRADGADDQDTWVSLEIFEHRDGEYERVRDTISSSASLAFKYKDYSQKPYSHLMILAVDETAQVYWYYPSYIDEKSNPRSIPIRAEKGEYQLPDEVSHHFSSGRIQLIAIFSRTPLSVRDVERDIAKKTRLSSAATGMERLSISGTAQYLRSLRVEAGGETGL